MRAAEAFQRIARIRLAHAADNAELLKIARRPEALHQTHVGVRRLHAALSAFKLMVTDDDLGPIEIELKWLAGELDSARDLDVFIHDAFAPAAAPQSPETVAE